MPRKLTILLVALATSLSACATDGVVRDAVINARSAYEQSSDRVVHSKDGKAACQCTAVCQYD